MAPSPSARRPPLQPRPQPRSPGRRPASHQSGPPRRSHRGRRLALLVLAVATVAALAFLYLSRGTSTTRPSSDFVGTSQGVVTAVHEIDVSAQRVQRFGELHSFDTTALSQIVAMSSQLTTLQRIDAAATARQRPLADQAVSATQQAIDAAIRYRKAVAFTYRLVDADSAQQDLNRAVATLHQQAQAWPHS